MNGSHRVYELYNESNCSLVYDSRLGRVMGPPRFPFSAYTYMGAKTAPQGAGSNRTVYGCHSCRFTDRALEG